MGPKILVDGLKRCLDGNEKILSWYVERVLEGVREQTDKQINELYHVEY